MRTLYLLFVGLVLSLVSCKSSQDASPQYQYMGDVGTYISGAGTMTVTTPDTTITFTAPKDALTITLLKTSANMFNLSATNTNNYMLLTLSDIVKSNSSYNNVSFGLQYKKEVTTIQYIGSGTLNAIDYNSADGILISGNFLGIITMAPGYLTNVNVSGTFNYKLNAK